MAFAKAQNVQSPAEFLGYELGDQFTRHASVVDYFEQVAANSDWVTYQKYGETNERRPLTYAIITTPENHANLEEIRTNNLKNTGILDGSASPDKAIVWLSYNVHGNEASSTEAAMNTIYKLITEKKDWLKDVVIIMDPCVNPDGRDRYANWYNQVRAMPNDIAQDAAEHHEPWPGGRPNHYLFDLNRDWAWATQKESKARIKVYNKWMPQIHVDFHEQGINDPYYFAPAAEPFHEVITDFQRDFQTEIGKNHAKYFDENGWLYFTKERFDLLYPSYGDTYPIYMGAIGMTFEQAGHGRAGLGIKTDEGSILTLKDRLTHHTTTGLSTIEVAAKNAKKLNDEFNKFFHQDVKGYKSYVIKGNPEKIKELTDLLDIHEIKYGFTASGNAKGYNFTAVDNGNMNYDKALVVSTDQPKGTMVKVLFDPDTQLNTPLTYDITAWSLPYAYGLETVGSNSLISTSALSEKNTISNNLTPGAPGYFANWDSMQDAKFLAALLKNDIKVRFTERPFVSGGKKYDRGTLVIMKSDNMTVKGLAETVSKLANEHQVEVTTAQTSFASSGPDFGSSSLKLIKTPRIALLKGEGTSSLSFGAAWYFFEQDLQYPVTNLDTDYFSRVDLSKFDVLVIPDGYYGGVMSDNTLSKIKDYVRSGGKVIAISGAVSAFAGKDGFALKENKQKEAPKDTSAMLAPYADREINQVENFITGSIFKTKVDATHPLAFGYNDTYFSLKLGSDSYSYLDNGYNVAYIDEPQSVSGFAGEKAKAKLNNSLVFGEERMGSGSFVYMVDDPLFRAFWQNGKLFMANAIFFVNNNKFIL